MLRQTRTLTVLLFAAIVGIATSAYAAPTQSAAKKAKRSSKKTVAAQTAPQPAPEPPKTPAQLPPVPPTVTYTNGQLSIDAPNSTLSDVLAGVKRATGANVEGGGGERIVAHLGPGKPRDVLTSLLRNSRYDFIILAPKGDPTGLQRVMLMARAGSEPTSNAAPTQGLLPAAQRGSQPTPQVANTNPDDDGQDAEEDVSPKGPMTAEPEGPPPQPTPEQPGPQPQPNIAPQEAPQQNSGGDQQQGPPVKTPEQLFRELQQLQQQQQQQPQQPQQQR